MRPLIEFSFDTILARSNNIFEIMTVEAIDVLLKARRDNFVNFVDPGYTLTGDPYIQLQFLEKSCISRMAEVEVAREAAAMTLTTRRT